MGPHGKCILLFPRYAKVAADVLGRLAHVTPTDRVGESKLETDPWLKIRRPETTPHAYFLGKILGACERPKLLVGFVGIQQRNLRHAFDPTYDKNVAASDQHLFRSLSNRLEP